jgi:hypothetical protein
MMASIASPSPAKNAEASACYTTDVVDAIETGIAMRKHVDTFAANRSH